MFLKNWLAKKLFPGISISRHSKSLTVLPGVVKVALVAAGELAQRARLEGLLPVPAAAETREGGGGRGAAAVREQPLAARSSVQVVTRLSGDAPTGRLGQFFTWEEMAVSQKADLHGIDNTPPHSALRNLQLLVVNVLAWC